MIAGKSLAWLFSVPWLLGVGPALAQEEGPGEPMPAEVVEPADDALDEAREQIAALRARLEDQTALTEEEATERGRLRLLLDDASLLLDDRESDGERLAAAQRLGERGDTDALPFLRAAARSRSEAVQVAAVRAASALDDAAIPQDVLYDPNLSFSARREAIGALVSLQRREAGEHLWAAANDRKLWRSLRRDAAVGFEEGYPDLLAELGPPTTASDPLGFTAGVLANGVAGGVLLSSIGTWGRSDEAVVIGALGGSAVGLGTAVLYTRQRPLTAGQGLRYASDVAWGLTAAGLASGLTYSDAWDLRDRHRANLSALYRAVGVGVGAGLGMARLGDDIDPVDVVESDLSGVLGLALAMSISDLGWSAVSQWRPNEWACDTWDLDVPEPLACRHRDYRDVSLWSAGLVGAAAGLGIHAAVREAWDLQPEDLLFASVVGAEAAWIGGWLPETLDVRTRASHAIAPLTGGFAAGLLASHFRPVGPGISAGMAWGTLLGNTGGYGIASLADAPEEYRVAIMLAAGAAGTVAGGFAGAHLSPTPGDMAMLAIGVPLATAEGAAIGHYLDKKGGFSAEQSTGLWLTSFSVSGIGLTALATQVDPRPGDMVFLGTAAAWGVWYGTMTPLAMQLPGDPEDGVLAATLTSDAFLLLGGLALIRPLDLEPRHTAVAQISGVAGATAGALAVAMASAEAEHVAAGAVIGSTVGLVTGAFLTPVVRSKPERKRQASLRPRIRVPGTWAVQLLPTVQEDGQPGLYAGVTATGL
ncbi:MAG: hypothetical protein JRI25_14920 [Deltaproteobacteria bacterium]|nr:hypothetical protein [Deltaproteobacteria bacterium]